MNLNNLNELHRLSKDDQIETLEIIIACIYSGLKQVFSKEHLKIFMANVQENVEITTEKRRKQ